MKNIFLCCFFIFLFENKQVIAQNKSQEPIKKYKLQIKAYDYESKDILEGTYIKLFNLTKKGLVDSAIVLDGFATFTLNKGNNYDIIAQRAQYMTRRANFNAACYLQDPKKVFCVSGINIKNVTKQADGSCSRIRFTHRFSCE